MFELTPTIIKASDIAEGMLLATPGSNGDMLAITFHQISKVEKCQHILCSSACVPGVLVTLENGRSRTFNNVSYVLVGLSEEPE